MVVDLTGCTDPLLLTDDIESTVLDEYGFRALELLCLELLFCQPYLAIPKITRVPSPYLILGYMARRRTNVD